MKLNKLLIVAGHGGKDTGAVANNIIERDINLIVAKKVQELMSKFCDIKMTRTDNETYLTPYECAVIGNKWGADLALHIHHNGGGGDGAEIIHTVFTEDSMGDELSEKIADKFRVIGQNVRRVFSRWNSKENNDYYSAIRNADQDAVITEFAFVDSKDSKMLTDEWLDAEAYAISSALIEFYNLEVKMSYKDVELEEILNMALENPDDMINLIDTLVLLSNNNFDLGIIQKSGKFIDDAILKVFKVAYELGKEGYYD